MKKKEKKVDELFHDIKSPLITISGYLQLLQIDLEESGYSDKYLDIILKEVERMNQNINFLNQEIKKILVNTINP